MKLNKMKELKKIIGNEKPILLVEKRGCDFWKGDNINDASDLQNYRLFGKGLKSGNRIYLFEITRGYKRRFYSKKKDGNGELIRLKKPILEHEQQVCIHNYFHELDNNGYTMCYGDTKLLNQQWQFINKNDLRYTKKDLLRVVNKFNDYKLQDVIIIESVYNELDKIKGYREQAIIEDCEIITETMKTSEHHVLKFYSRDLESYFMYDLITKNIVG